jgi:hypothetical protein
METKQEYHLRKKKEYDKQKRTFLAWYKTQRGCEMCGYDEHPAALTFDHINPEEKLFNIANYGSHSWADILCEVAKCRVLCANCHNIHSFNNYDNDNNLSKVTEQTRELMADILRVDYLNG